MRRSIRFTRLLAVLCLLSLCAVCLGQNRPVTGVPSSCPVTKSSDRPFVPPAPHPVRPSVGQFWFGTDRLWTALPLTGTWSGLPHYTPADPTYRQKLFFWRQGYDPHAEPSALTVTGRRIDGPAGPLQSDGKGNGSWTQSDQFIVAGINFPTLGCWEITGNFDGDQLTFVVWVAR
jgi:hypothetical protein